MTFFCTERGQHALQTNSAVQKLLYLNDAVGIVNSEGPDQIAPQIDPIGAV